jgi:hypothetical protein
MSKHRIQSHGDLKGEMRSVARGAKRAPADAGEPSFNSVGALLRLMTPEIGRCLPSFVIESRSQSPNSPTIAGARVSQPEQRGAGRSKRCSDRPNFYERGIFILVVTAGSKAFHQQNAARHDQ